MEIPFKKSILASSLILSATTGQAELRQTGRYVLSPEVPIAGGISYDRLFVLISKERVIEYGEPVSIEVNEKQGTVDFSSFDDVVIRIPIEDALVQPNRIEPTQY